MQRALCVCALLGMTATFAAAGEGPVAARSAAIKIGPGASLGGQRVLSPDSAWNTPIDDLPVDPESARLIATLGVDTPLHPDFGTVWNNVPWGIPYVVVNGAAPRHPVRFEYAGESDDVPYPIPANPPIEGVAPGRLPIGDSGDRHLLVIDRDNEKLYELYAVRFVDGMWQAGSGAVWDLFGNTRRPRGWTSADAAGLPIFPGLVRYDEVIQFGRVEHALRFTAPRTRRAFVGPATHFASSSDDRALPPMGARLRLRAAIDENAFPASVRPIVVALKRYGMILADNGGALYLSGAPDARWNDAEIAQLRKLRGRDFEVVAMSTPVTP